MREGIPRNWVEASPPLALAVGVVQALPDDEADNPGDVMEA
jgi:hypothetical protein